MYIEEPFMENLNGQGKKNDRSAITVKHVKTELIYNGILPQTGNF